MRLTHFEAFRPVCPRCAAAGQRRPLELADVFDDADGDVSAGILHCTAADCRHEYPVIEGIPVIVPNLAALLSEQGAGLLLCQDLHPALESLVGDALGPDGWLDALRRTASTYGWDAYADLDPEEGPSIAGILPGAARRCLARLDDLAGQPSADMVLDLGCGAGRTSFDLAARNPGALVLGLDIHLGLLRLARRAARGLVDYPRRRIGLVYDRRRFAVRLPGADRVDFWACDASALPFADGAADLVAALNLLDCVADPASLLAELSRVLSSGGRLLLSTPYDWSSHATQPAQWIGGHSQRADHQGAGEVFLRILLRQGAHANAVEGLALVAEDAGFPWHTRLHERSTVTYSTHLLALEKRAET